VILDGWLTSLPSVRSRALSPSLRPFSHPRLHSQHPRPGALTAASGSSLGPGLSFLVVGFHSTPTPCLARGRKYGLPPLFPGVGVVLLNTAELTGGEAVMPRRQCPSHPNEKEFFIHFTAKCSEKTPVKVFGRRQKEQVSGHKQ